MYSQDGVNKNDKVLIIDDLLATGGTVEVVGCAFLIELTELKGRDLLEGKKVKALIEYPY